MPLNFKDASSAESTKLFWTLLDFKIGSASCNNERKSEGARVDWLQICWTI